MQDLDGQVTWSDLGISFGKMFQEHSVPTAEKTSESCLKRSAKSQTKMPLFLNLRKGGAEREPSWETGGALHGEFMTLSFGESPKEENVSRLSQILEERAHPKYSLSERACAGILNRAERRGKQLPEELRIALENQARSGSEAMNPTQ